MRRRTIAALALGVLAIACATGAIGETSETRRPPADLPTRIDAATPDGDAEIAGIVRDGVTIGCACLDARAPEGAAVARELELPGGSDTLTVHHGRGERSYAIDLPARRKLRIMARIGDRPPIIT
ncbi:MAG: hypothetical protein R3A79_21730 [Nannocystaceae bacterium]